MLPTDATVAEALALVRNPDLSPALESTLCLPAAARSRPAASSVRTFQRLLREPRRRWWAASGYRPGTDSPDTVDAGDQLSRDYNWSGGGRRKTRITASAR